MLLPGIIIIIIITMIIIIIIIIIIAQAQRPRRRAILEPQAAEAAVWGGCVMYVCGLPVF